MPVITSDLAQIIFLLKVPCGNFECFLNKPRSCWLRLLAGCLIDPDCFHLRLMWRLSLDSFKPFLLQAIVYKCQAGCEPLQTMEHSVSFQHQSTYSLLQFLRLAHVERGKVCANMHKIDRTLVQSETLGHPFISSTASIWNCIWNVV